MPAGVLLAIGITLMLIGSDPTGAIFAFYFAPLVTVIMGIGLVTGFFLAAKKLVPEDQRAFYRFQAVSILWAPPLAVVSGVVAMILLSVLALLAGGS